MFTTIREWWRRQREAAREEERKRPVIEAAVRHYRSLASAPPIESMCRVVGTDAEGDVVRICYEAPWIPPPRRWFRVVGSEVYELTVEEALRIDRAVWR